MRQRRNCRRFLTWLIPYRRIHLNRGTRSADEQPTSQSYATRRAGATAGIRSQAHAVSDEATTLVCPPGSHARNDKRTTRLLIWLSPQSAYSPLSSARRRWYGFAPPAPTAIVGQLNEPLRGSQHVAGCCCVDHIQGKRHHLQPRLPGATFGHARLLTKRYLRTRKRILLDFAVRPTPIGV